MDPFRNCAAGVARSPSPIGRSLNRRSAKLFRPEDFAGLTTITASRYRARARLRRIRWLRNFYLMPQPPLLCEEGNTPHSTFLQFIHAFIVSCNSGSQNKSGRSSVAAVYDRRSYSSGLETVAVKPAVIDRRYRRTVTKIVHLFLIQENRPPTIARFDPFKSLLVPLDAYTIEPYFSFEVCSSIYP